MLSTEIAVVGGGPAGLNAAIEAAKSGAEVVLIDENAKPGGQLVKQIHKFFGSEEHGAGVRGINIANNLIEEAKQRGVRLSLNTVAWGLFGNKILALSTEEKSYRLAAEKIVLATGTRENALAFPGWTLPGVMGAGAAQTMINVYRVLPGKRVLMVGAGNVGLIVAYQLMQAGAKVVAVVEIKPTIGGYGVHASKIRRYDVPIFVSHTMREAKGEDKVEEATIVRIDKEGQPIPGSEKRWEVDSVCIATGLTPSTELAWMAGCEHINFPELGGHVPGHNNDMETIVPGIYVCGDVSGVEEATTAMEEGKIAGISAAETLGYLSRSNANSRIEECWERLETLRTGPFGWIAGKAKRRLMTRTGRRIRQNLTNVDI